MAKIFLQNSGIGGVSDGSRAGYKGAYADGIGVDVRSDPDKISSNNALTKDSSTTVTDLVKWIREYNGEYYMYGDSGKIYNRATNGTYTNIKTVSDSNGQGMEIFNESLWYANDDGLGKATGIGGTESFEDDYFLTETTEIDNEYDEDNTGQTYTVPSSITETAANKIVFTADYDEYIAVGFAINAKGTGDWTITVHLDADDSVIAEKTIENANLPSSVKFYRLEFNTPFNLTVGTDYHIHLTSSDGTGTVITSTTGDLSTVQYSIYKFLRDEDVDQFSTKTIDDDSTELSTTSITLSTTLKESEKQSFIPEKSSLIAISVLLRTVTSGDITLTLHNANDEVIAEKTVAFASLRGGRSFYKFIFDEVVYLQIGGDYHFHIVTTGVATVLSASSSLEDVYFKTHFPVLISDDDFHTMKVFSNLLCIGNGRFLATLDDSEIYEPEALIFPKGEKVRSLETIGDYIAISTWRGSSLSDYGTSRMYLWDGVSDTFNAFLDFDGQINAMKNEGNNQLAVISGTDGSIYYYTGGITLMRKMKGLAVGDTIEIYPAALDVWEGILRIGISDGTSTDFDRVVWSYGRKDKDVPLSLTKDYPISTGTTTGTGVQIGAVLGISRSTFFVSWKDSSTYGVDIIDTSNKQSSTNIEYLRFDGGKPSLEKKTNAITVRCVPLTTGQSITVKYKINNEASWTTAGTMSYTDTNDIFLQSFPIASAKKRYYDFEIRLELNTSSGVAPEILAVSMDVDEKDQHQQNKRS